MKRRCETAAVKVLLTSTSILQVFQLYLNVHCHSLCPREESGSVMDIGLINDSNVKLTQNFPLFSNCAIVPECTRTIKCVTFKSCNINETNECVTQLITKLNRPPAHQLCMKTFLNYDRKTIWNFTLLIPFSAIHLYTQYDPNTLTLLPHCLLLSSDDSDRMQVI